MALTSLTSPVGTELTDFSPSRLSTAGQCGRKFEYNYINGIPAPYDKGALLLGDAVHDGVQAWYELPDDGPVQGYQMIDLAPVICAQWERLLPPSVWKLVQEMRELDAECEAVAAAILFKRPTLKSPRTTVDFLKSRAGMEFGKARDAMLEFCDLLPDVKWPKDEDPYKAYCKAAEWGANMQRRWQHLPRPIVVEGGFNVELFGFRVRGRIDQLRIDPTRHGEPLMAIVDMKSGRNALTAMEAFLQMFVYYKAVEANPEWPTTDRVALYLTRKDQYQQGRIDPVRHARLASQVLHGRARQIAMGQFEPSFGFWCKSCDFSDICRNEISMWNDEFGLVHELMAT